MMPCVLAADNIENDLGAQQYSLNRVGLRVRCASTLKGFQEEYGENLLDLDCVHLDIRFNGPTPDGLDSLAEVRAGGQGADIPVLVVSGYINDAAYQKAEALGVISSIHKWYKKPCDYGILALDTIKTINESHYGKGKKAFERYMGSFPPHEHALLRNALRTCPAALLRPIELQPRILLEQLDKLGMKMSHLAEQDSSEGLERTFHTFAEVVKSHLSDYFFGLAVPLETLAGHLAHVVSRLDTSRLSASSIALLQSVLADLKNYDLREDRVYEQRIALERAFETPLGPVFKRASDLDDYLHIIDSEAEDEEEEK